MIVLVNNLNSWRSEEDLNFSKFVANLHIRFLTLHKNNKKAQLRKDLTKMNSNFILTISL